MLPQYLFSPSFSRTQSNLQYIHHLLVVILVVLTTLTFRFSLPISQLMAKAIPVRGAIFKKPA